MKDRVLITGGSGSLGSKLVEFYLASRPETTVICFSRDIHKQNALQAKLEAKGLGQQAHDNLRLFIGDVRDKNRLSWAIGKRVATVIHTAALKYVGAGEYNAPEFIETNIEGTRNVAEVAIRAGVQKVLFISTDKSVQSLNLYGRTKAVAERMWIRHNSFGAPNTKLSVVRYGNVFDSVGSVIQVWQERATAGLPIMVRDPDPTRFICFLDWGVQWVVRALELMRGGEVFVPWGLQAVSMHDLAAAFAAETGVAITHEPLQAGEKQHEILIAPEETCQTGRVEEFWVVNPDDPQWQYESWPVAGPEQVYSSDNVPRVDGKRFLEIYRRIAREV